MANFNAGKDAKTVNVHLKLSLRAGVKNKSTLAWTISVYDADADLLEDTYTNIYKF
jgi:hypothetical protein